MRTYGRVYKEVGGNWIPGPWQVVETDKSGYNDLIYLVTLAQVLKLELNESPFWANYGIPARNSVLMQTHPDYYIARTQQQFAQYFANLIVWPTPGTTGPGVTPEYNFSAITMQGFRFVSSEIPQ